MLGVNWYMLSNTVHYTYGRFLWTMRNDTLTQRLPLNVRDVKVNNISHTPFPDKDGNGDLQLVYEIGVPILIVGDASSCTVWYDVGGVPLPFGRRVRMSV